MNTTIPEELVEQVEQGNVLLFIGERIVHDAAGDGAFEQLAAQLVGRAGMSEVQGLTFAQIAQLYEDEKGAHELLLFVKRYFEALGNHPQAVHRLIAELTDCTILATTCFDGRLEEAFEEAGRPLNRIIGNVDVAFEQERHSQLYKLRGSLERIESLILTEEAYETFFEDHASISLVLQGYLARKTILFVGYDLTDPYFKRLYRKVTVSLDNFTRRAYAFGAAPPAHIASWARRRQIEVIEADVTDFLESLTAQLAARKAAAHRFLSLSKKDKLNAQADALPERPYKFLDYYEAKDAGIFYGRQQETQHLCALIHAHRLVLLYGASGVGKTSLLLAGAVPRLEQATPAYHAIYIRALEDPTLVIRRTLRRQLPDANLPDEGLLVDFLAAVTKTLGQTLVIVLDQFEEFFIRLSPQFRAAFISELGTLYDARDVPVKVIFSLREDWLASMDEIEERIPGLFTTRMRVLRLTQTQAQQAITGPVKQLGISYEPALLERLLADLLGSNQEVMPPQLQLICSALYDGRREEDRVLKVATYERLGGVQGVLHRYLEEELSRLDPIEQALARAILEELVTSEKTKAVKSSAELALALEVKLRILVPLLEWLVRGRLLRTLKQETGHRAYELAHEYLIHEISLTADSQARKQAEELLQQEVENGQRFGTVLAADKLALISEVGDLLRLNDDAQALLLNSALQVGQDIEYWLNRIPEPTRRVELLTQATQNKLTIVRQRAVETLGSQDVPQAVAPLLTLALHDRNMDVRDTARQSLAQLTTQQPAIVERLKQEVTLSAQAENPTSRAALLRTLTYLPLSGLPLTLRMEVFMMRIRLHVTSLIEASLLTPQRRAMAMTTALLVLCVALAYAFSANSYHVYSKPSPIPGNENVIIIRQGHPLLRFSRLHETVVDTGMSVSQVANDHWDAVHSEQLWGLSSQTVRGGFYKWGQDVADALKFEDQTRMLWYLGQQEEALEAILKAIRSQDTELHGISVVLLEEIVKVEPQLVEANPQLAEEVIAVLLPLLEDENHDVRERARSALAQVAEGNPQPVGEEVLQTSLSLLEDKQSYARQQAASAQAQVAKANSQLVEQVIAALLPLLEDEEGYVCGSALSALAEVAESNPQVAKQIIAKLLALLKNEDYDVHSGIISVLTRIDTISTETMSVTTEVWCELLSADSPFVVISTLAETESVSSDVALEAIAALRPLAEEAPWNGSSERSAAFALGEIGQVNTQVAEEAIEVLVLLLEVPDYFTRANAGNALTKVINAYPNLVTSQVIEALLRRLKDPYVNSIAVRALTQIWLTDSEISLFVRKEIFERLSDEDEFVRAGAAEIVGLVIESRPEIANREVVDKLLSLLTDTSGKVCDQAGFALGEVVKVKPEVTPLVANRLIPLLLATDKEEGYNIRDNTALAWAHLVTASPEAASQNPQMTDAVIDLLNYGEEPVRARATTALAMIGVVSSQPDTSQIVEALVTRLALDREEDGDVQNRTIKALAQIYAGQPSPPSLNLLIPPLTAPLDSQQRKLDSQALFLVALWEPSLEPEIDEELEVLSNSQEPHKRLIANQTLQMLKMASQAHKAAELDREQLEQATNRLKTLCQWSDYNHRCNTTGERPNFFGEDFTWAVGEAITWLEEQSYEENAHTIAK